jgi:chitinase
VKARMLSFGSLAVLLLTVAAAPASAGGRAGFPAHVFAPYVYVQQDPTFPLVSASNATGVTQYTLAFINDQGSCKAGWDSGISLSSGFYGQAVHQIRAKGGDVIVSFGGAGGTELARSCPTVSALRHQYQAVVTKYNLRRLDFDIEGGPTLADAAATNRRNKAIAALQHASDATGKPVTVQFTLGVGTDGLPKPQRDLLKNAVNNGVRVGLVNIMVMDYGGSTPGDQMAQNAKDAANATWRQLHQIFPSRTAAQRWAMIGLTPMIGQNDVADEVFTLDDATTLLHFAQAKGVGLIGFWSASRDKQCAGRASDQCSGVDQEKYEFANTFAGF